MFGPHLLLLFERAISEDYNETKINYVVDSIQVLNKTNQI